MNEKEFLEIFNFVKIPDEGGNVMNTISSQELSVMDMSGIDGGDISEITEAEFLIHKMHQSDAPI